MDTLNPEHSVFGGAARFTVRDMSGGILSCQGLIPIWTHYGCKSLIGAMPPHVHRKLRLPSGRKSVHAFYNDLHNWFVVALDQRV